MALTSANLVILLTEPGFRRSLILSESKYTQRGWWRWKELIFLEKLCPVGWIHTLRLLLHPAVNLPSALFWCPNKIYSLQVCLVVFLSAIKEFLQKTVNANLMSNNLIDSLSSEDPPGGTWKWSLHTDGWQVSECTTQTANWCQRWESQSLHGCRHQSWKREPVGQFAIVRVSKHKSRKTASAGRCMLSALVT